METEVRMHTPQCPYDGRRHGPETCVCPCRVCGEIGHLWCGRSYTWDEILAGLDREDAE